jgi:hypothetical protein
MTGRFDGPHGYHQRHSRLVEAEAFHDIVWHTGEEAGFGSRYMADFPVVPLDKVRPSSISTLIRRNRDDA